MSVRSPADLYYADELPGPDALVVHTRQARPDAGRAAGRLAVTDVAPFVRGGETVFVCGSPGFADAAPAVLLEAGVPVNDIRVERFGPSG